MTWEQTKLKYLTKARKEWLRDRWAALTLVQWKRWLILIACVWFAIHRLIWPDAKVDWITVAMLGIAAIVFLLPEVRSLLPFIKRIRFGDTEVELQLAATELGSAVEAAKETFPLSAPDPDRLANVVEQFSRDPRAALLLLSAQVEAELRRVTHYADRSKAAPILRLIDEAIASGLLPASLRDPIRKFQIVRNRIAHDAGFNVDESTLLSVIDSGMELLGILRAIPDAESPPQ